MDLKSFILFAVAITLEVVATVLFKKGTNRLANSMRQGWLSHLDNIINALKTKEIALGIFLYAIEYVFWIAFLASVDISKAFPLSSVHCFNSFSLKTYVKRTGQCLSLVGSHFYCCGDLSCRRQYLIGDD